jgi:tryptophanyl-tRNA synthetase
MQEENDTWYFIADLHAITIRQNPATFGEQIRQSYTALLATGIDPDKSTVFVQSHVHAHAELAWLLNCYTYFGELSRMTQFKDKSERHTDNVNAGLFDYPVLMAADILIYNSDYVPTGIDQKQHLELTRNIAERFNGIYGDTFKIPEPFITRETAKIMSLSEPSKKMSKSDTNPNSYVSVLDSRDEIIKKFKKAVTDSESLVQYRENDETKEGINNLIRIYSAAAGNSFSEIEKEFDGKGYGTVKTAVGEAVADILAPVREKYNRLMADKDSINGCMKKGAERAAVIADETVRTVKAKIGLI